MNTTPSRTALILAFAAIYLIWGSTYLGIRVAVESMPPFLMAAARFLTAGTILFTVLKLRGAAWPTARQWRANAIIGTFLLLGGNGAVVWAEQYVPSGITALLIGIGPLFIVLTEWAWPGGTRPGATTAFALLLGFAGVTWLAAPWENTSHGGLHLGGVAAILLGCASWGVGSIYSRHSKHGADSIVAASLQMLGGGTSLLLVAIIHGDFAALNLAAIPPRAWGAFAYLIGMGSLVGFSTFVWLMKHSTPARVSTYAYVNPIVAVFLGWLLLHEPIGPRTLVASAVIVTAVAIITTQKAKSAPAPAQAAAAEQTPSPRHIGPATVPGSSPD
ncbi:MAG: EamA family transporter [Verrucomicrobia bacterium]|nr:EamA family transporter [Verrucomicrobiota bacterium]